MMADEIIDEVVKHPRGQHNRVHAFVRRRHLAHEAIDDGRVQYIESAEAERIADGVFCENGELFRQLAEVEAQERETNRKKWDKLRSLGLG